MKDKASHLGLWHLAEPHRSDSQISCNASLTLKAVCEIGHDSHFTELSQREIILSKIILAKELNLDFRPFIRLSVLGFGMLAAHPALSFYICLCL